jgi:ubiquinone/menaquinone biosynthesis C-methylase UbiE
LYIKVLKAFAMNTWKQKRSVMRRYNLTAQIYDARYCEEQEAKYKTALDKLSLDAGVILDVGCGSGLFFRHVADDAKLVVGIDVSGALLKLAKERAKNYQNVHLVLADADNLPFKQEVFTYVFAFTVLQNMPNPAKTLRGFKIVALRDAFFVVSGLKAAVSLEVFGQYLDAAGFKVVSIVTDDTLRCHIAICTDH